MACPRSRVLRDADHAVGDAGRRVRNRHRLDRMLVDSAIAVSATRRAMIVASRRATAPASSAIVDHDVAVAVAHRAAPMTYAPARPA